MTARDIIESNIVIKPIGVIINDTKEPSKPGCEVGTVSRIELEPSLRKFTEGLEEFSHIMVVFWMHKLSRERDIPARVHPRGRQDLPLVGLFATRSPYRPNPVGISIVQLLNCHETTLTVETLDAIDGTPVIDIKPYLPGNAIDDARYPQWVFQL